MSFSQSNHLPTGYSFRQANQEDSMKVFCFEELITKYFLSARIILVFITICILIIVLKSTAYVWSSWDFFFLCLPLFVLCYLAFLLHVQYINGVQNGLISVWLVERRNIAYGYMAYKNSTEYTLLYRLFVLNEHRGRGIGRFLINHYIDTARKPIYVISLSELRTFYSLNGFVDVDFSNVPNELSRFRERNGIQLMVFQNDVAL
jgi:GNAT superfamily N-acetyltransferase